MNHIFLVPLSPSFIITFPSIMEYQQWCEKLYSVLTARSPTPQQNTKVHLFKNSGFFYMKYFSFSFNHLLIDQN